MVAIARQTTWASLQILTASALNGEFNVVFNAWNNADAGTGLWNNVKISSSSSNPMECKSSATACEFDIDCTGSSGTPIMSFRRSGTAYFTMGVDGAASNVFKVGTTSLTTGNSLFLNSNGQLGIGIAPSNLLHVEATGAFTALFKCSDAVNDRAVTLKIQGGSMSSTDLTGPTIKFDQSAGSQGSLLFTNTADTQIFKMYQNGNVVVGSAAVATNAATGFFYITSCAGTPTGTPTTQSGRSAMVYDSTNNKFYVYNSGWKGVTVS